MLYDRWRQIAQDRRSEPALLELTSGRRWSFIELARAVESAPCPSGPLVCPQGHAAESVIQTLAAWRTRSVVCPLEPGQPPPAVPLPPASCVHLKITSATTGAPRVVAFTAEQLAADAENIVATMGLRPEWPNLAVISLAHSYGFSNLVLPLALSGIPLILGPSPLPEAVRQAARCVADLTLPAVPALWRAWHDAGAIPANVRRAISAGAPLPVALEQDISRSTGLKVHNFYGSSECGGIAYDTSEAPRTENACVGRPMCNVSVAVGDDGCLEVRSRAVAETYWPEPHPTLGAGRFQTADLAELRHDQVFLRGRLSDLINIAGRKVAPETIEQALRGHESVRGCLVFGLPSATGDRSEVIVACVESRGAGAGADELKQHLLARLPAWQVPREWWFVESLAPDGRGKLSRAQWRARYLVAHGA
jgi:acyl-CoA synthetase (AMP-forming)/AMP-acid ligase II